MAHPREQDKEESMRFPEIPREMMIERLAHHEGAVSIVLDTDVYCEIDDQFAIVHALMSKHLDVQAIYAAPFYSNIPHYVNTRNHSPADGMNKSYEEIQRIVQLLGRSSKDLVFRGSGDFIEDVSKPIQSEATKDLIRRAKTKEAVFVEEMAVAYSSFAKTVQPFPAVREGFGPGDSFAVLGNGPLGMLHGIMARIQGGGMAIATDLADSRLKMAKDFYADHTINAQRVPAKERVQQIKELTHGVGPDLVIEAAGVPEVFLEALEMVRKGGTVVEVGNWVDMGQTVPLNVMQHISSKNVHIHAVYHCGNKWAPVLTAMDRFSKQFPFEKMITHRMSLPEVIKNIGIVLDPNKCMKVEVIPHK